MFSKSLSTQFTNLSLKKIGGPSRVSYSSEPQKIEEGIRLADNYRYHCNMY